MSFRDFLSFHCSKGAYILQLLFFEKWIYFLPETWRWLSFWQLNQWLYNSKIFLIHLFCFIDKTATQQRIDMLWHEQQQCTFHFYIIWYLEFGFCTTYMENYVGRDKKESILIIRWMKCWLTFVMRVSFQWNTEMQILFQTP